MQHDAWAKETGDKYNTNYIDKSSPTSGEHQAVSDKIFRLQMTVNLHEFISIKDKNPQQFTRR